MNEGMTMACRPQGSVERWELIECLKKRDLSLQIVQPVS